MIKKYIVLFFLIFAAHAHSADTVDITPQLDVFFAPWDTYTAEQIFAAGHDGAFAPLNPPTNINRAGQEAWLKITLGPDAAGKILEVPGQIFNYIDIWFRADNGSVTHYRAGDLYPYVEREIRHVGAAFPLPAISRGEIDVLIRARNATSHPMNFAAWVWPAAEFEAYVMNKRAWYGAFIGAILALCIYNLFLSITLRDPSYIFYIGYVLCLSFSVLMLSGLAEEYLWPNGKPATFVSALTGLGAFLAVGFVNQFLHIRRRYVRAFWVSTVISALAFVCGLTLVFTHNLPFIASGISASVVHFLLLVCGLYFISMSFYDYFSGILQARYLALSMLVLLTCMLFYFAYTYGVLRYNLIIGHCLELGVLAEGVLLSLALADRITVLNQQKQAAERAMLETQRDFSRRLIRAQETERQLIAEALHDSIGHEVLVLRNMLTQQAPFNRHRNANTSEVTAGDPSAPIQQCSEIMDDLRRISHDLHPHMLERLGLEAALESTFERALGTSGINWTLDFDPSYEEPDKEIALTVYRVFQEALNNVLKHANASSVTGFLADRSGQLFCSVRDDGLGMDTTNLSAASLGLAESRGRIELLGGNFSIESSPGNGALIEFTVPKAYRPVMNERLIMEAPSIGL